MFTWYTLATGVVLALLAIRAYRLTRDALHPAVLMAPLFGYMYCAWPLMLNHDGQLYRLLSPAGLEQVSLLYLLSISALYLGLQPRPNMLAAGGLSFNMFSVEMSENTRRNMARLALFLGTLAVLAYVYKIGNVGGFEAAYGRAKGGGRAASGYISESVMFAFPAVLLFALSRRPGRVTAADIVIALVMMMPHLIQGSLGGRRGPIFLALVTLFLAWFMARRQMPRMRTVIIGVALCGLAVVFVWSQRHEVYLGSGGEVQMERMWEKIVPEDAVNPGNTYVVGAATVLMADRLDFFYWGYRYFVTFFVRPIPRQIWPDKYQDMGADWLLRFGEEVRERRYYTAVGFVPLAGSAVGYIADGYLEFSWGVLLLSYVLGRLFGIVWHRHVDQGQFWSMLYAVMVVLSIYLAAQSVTAWAHRLLFIGGMTWIFWRLFMRSAANAVAAGHWSERSTD